MIFSVLFNFSPYRNLIPSSPSLLIIAYFLVISCHFSSAGQQNKTINVGFLVVEVLKSRQKCMALFPLCCSWQQLKFCSVPLYICNLERLRVQEVRCTSLCPSGTSRWVTRKLSITQTSVWSFTPNWPIHITNLRCRPRPPLSTSRSHVKAWKTSCWPTLFVKRGQISKRQRYWTFVLLVWERKLDCRPF